MQLASRLSRIEPSITLTLDARAKAMKAEGLDVVNMTVGEPDFPASKLVRTAAVERVKSGDVRYTPAAGMPGLRAAVADYLTETRGGSWLNANVTICHSAKHALSATLMALVEDGDEVLIPTPAWASYFDQVRIAGAEPVLVPCTSSKNGFHPDFDAMSAAVTPRTRVLMINSPNNPTGTVWSRDEIERVAAFAQEHDLWLISDEIYYRLVYGGVECTSPASCSNDARARSLIVDGASKCFAMTGYRIGFVAGPAEVASAVATLGSQTNGSPNTIGQVAYERALRESAPETRRMLSAFAERREVLLAGLTELGLETPEPKGAFYAFPNVVRYMDERGSVGFCEDLLEEERLALIPGSAFGADEHVRFSYATDLKSIEEALRRFAAFLKRREG